MVIWACFASDSTARHHFFANVDFSFANTDIDAPHRGVCFKDSLLMKESKKRKIEKCPAPGGTRTHDLIISRGVRSTILLQPLPLIWKSRNKCILNFQFDPELKKEECFPALRCLCMTYNLVNDWGSFFSLDRLKITDLRCRDNPVVDAETLGSARQILIASITSLVSVPKLLLMNILVEFSPSNWP